MFTFTVVEILLLEDRSVLQSPQRVTGTERANIKQNSNTIFVSIFPNYAVARYWKLAIRKTRVKFTFAQSKNIESIFNHLVYWLKLIS